MTPEFWRDRRVFVTGHTGFLGGWLSLWLNQLGARVTGYSLAPPSRPNLFEAIGLDREVGSIIGDVRRGNVLASAMREADPEIVFHLAGKSLKSQAFDAPVETFSVNAMGAVNVLQAMRGSGNLLAGVFLTSDRVYSNAGNGAACQEDDRLGGRDPYGASEACAEIAIEAFRRSYLGEDVPVATVRTGNVIGGGDWAPARPLPDAVRAFSGGRPLRIHSPNARRCWLHALDLARGLLLLGEATVRDRSTPTCLNLGSGPGATATVAELIEQFGHLWGNGAGWIHEVPGDEETADEIVALLDGSLAREKLGWQPAWSLERTLKATVDWYQAFLAKRDVREVSLDQIAAMQGAN